MCFLNAKFNSTTGERLKKKMIYTTAINVNLKKYSGNKIATFDIIPAGTIVQIFKHFNVPVPLGLSINSTIVDNSLYQAS